MNAATTSRPSQQDAQSDYSDPPAGAEHQNGNGHSKGRAALSPLDKCEALRIRACTDAALSHAAVRVFTLLLTLMWRKEAGGFYKGELGVIAITSRRLARMAKVNCNGLWSRKQKRKKLGPDGKAVQVEKQTEEGTTICQFVWEET